MRPVSPVVPTAEADELRVAQSQPEYQTLPSIRSPEGSILPPGTILTRWIFSDEEKRVIAEQGYIYAAQMTFNQAVQPLLLSADVPEGFDGALKPLEEWPTEVEA